MTPKPQMSIADAFVAGANGLNDKIFGRHDATIPFSIEVLQIYLILAARGLILCGLKQ